MSDHGAHVLFSLSFGLTCGKHHVHVMRHRAGTSLCHGNIVFLFDVRQASRARRITTGAANCGKYHRFCGVVIEDANEKCSVHCPTASECPMGQSEWVNASILNFTITIYFVPDTLVPLISPSLPCYFMSQCDIRTFSPTPPPTSRPTPLPRVIILHISTLRGSSS